MNGEGRIGDLDVLLKMEEGEFEFGKFLLCHRDSCWIPTRKESAFGVLRGKESCKIELTHLPILLLSSLSSPRPDVVPSRAPTANESLEPRSYSPVNELMKTLIRGSYGFSSRSGCSSYGS